MNFLHLHYFKLVAKSENITKAAQEAYISTSGLSKVISSDWKVRWISTV